MGIVKELLGRTKARDCLIDLEKLRTVSDVNGIVIWGTGRSGMYALDVCRKVGIEVLCFVDGLPHRADEEIDGLMVYHSDVFFSKQENRTCVVLIACMAGYGAEEYLVQRGIRCLSFEVNFLAEFAKGISYQKLLLENENAIEQTYDMLWDEESRRVYQAVLAYRLSLDRSLISSIYDAHIYFDNDVVPDFHGRAFVDCGAFWGDTLECFMKSPNCTCETYIALEPIESEYVKLCALVRECKYSNVRTLQLGVWDRTTVLRFAAGQSSNGHVQENGQIALPASSIDHICAQQGVEADFIKMDIEGSEDAALRGGRETIQKNRPIIAASIYHHMKDLWELPLLMKKLNPDYKLYIRHHSHWGDDTVCYAV